MSPTVIDAGPRLRRPGAAAAQVLVHSQPNQDEADSLALGQRLAEGLHTDLIHCEAATTEELSEALRRAEPALVVTGSGDMGLPGQIAVTSVAAALVSEAGTPVALAPRGYASSHRRWDTIGAGFASRSGSSSAVDLASRLGSRLGALVIVLTVGDSNTSGFREAGYRGVTEYLRWKHEHATRVLARGSQLVPDGMRCQAQLKRGDGPAELHHAAEHLDLLVIGSAGPPHNPGVAQIGDLASALQGMPTPVLVVPDKARSERSSASSDGVDDPSTPTHLEAMMGPCRSQSEQTTASKVA